MVMHRQAERPGSVVAEASADKPQVDVPVDEASIERHLARHGFGVVADSSTESAGTEVTAGDRTTRRLRETS